LLKGLLSLDDTCKRDKRLLRHHLATVQHLEFTSSAALVSYTNKIDIAAWTDDVAYEILRNIQITSPPTCAAKATNFVTDNTNLLHPRIATA
jgi:predicted metal-dependent HD superfamily phosphohydrolase